MAVNQILKQVDVEVADQRVAPVEREAPVVQEVVDGLILPVKREAPVVREAVDGLAPMVVQLPNIPNESMAVNQILEQMDVEIDAEPAAPVEREAPVPGPENIRDTAGQRN